MVEQRLEWPMNEKNNAFHVLKLILNHIAKNSKNLRPKTNMIQKD